MRAIETEKEPEALYAMAILANEIWKKKPVISEKDYRIFCEDLKKTSGRDKEKMKHFLKYIKENHLIDADDVHCNEDISV